MESDERDGEQAALAPAPAASGALRPADRPLAELEAVIERGRQAFVEVGLALLEIRARRLFRELGFTTFTDYCRQRWDFTPQRAVQLIQAAGVVETVRSLTAVAPAVASHAEALAPLRHEPEAMADAWREAVASAGGPGSGGPGGPVRVTTALVEEAVERRRARGQADAHAERASAQAGAVAGHVASLGDGLPFDRIARADALTYLRSLPDGCAHLCVTSPPYWAKRTYTDGPDGAHPDEVGQEPDPQTYVEVLRRIVGQIGRVLREDGWLFLNLGDTYASRPGGYRGDPDRARGVSASARRHAGTASDRRRFDVPEKSLCLVPWRVVAALVQQDGWRCRNVIAWTKPDHQPEHVHDRLTQAWEPVFALTRGAYPYFQRGRNEGDVWTIGVGGDATARELGHPAPFPPKLVHRIVGHACPPGGVVLDPFAGSGTVLRVARSAGRRFLGCDLAGPPPVDGT
jgi:DNA modification methylase